MWMLATVPQWWIEELECMNMDILFDSQNPISTRKKLDLGGEIHDRWISWILEWMKKNILRAFSLENSLNAPWELEHRFLIVIMNDQMKHVSLLLYQFCASKLKGTAAHDKKKDNTPHRAWEPSKIGLLSKGWSWPLPRVDVNLNLYLNVRWSWVQDLSLVRGKMMKDARKWIENACKAWFLRLEK